MHGITHAYWWRLCRGERAPTTHIAFRIIDILGLDQDTADLLLDECVDRGGIVAQHAETPRVALLVAAAASDQYDPRGPHLQPICNRRAGDRTM